MIKNRSIIAVLVITFALVGCAMRIPTPPLSETVKVHLLGKKIYVFPDVYKPDIVSFFLLKNTHIDKGDVVLDLGTGTGIQSILAAKEARKILATDIDPKAVENAKYNVNYHKLNSKIEVKQGDLFETVEDRENFDVIIFSPRFPRKVPIRTSDLFDGTFKDKDWEVIRRFFSEAPRYMKEDGRIFYMIGFDRNIPHVKKIINKYELQIKNSSTMLLDKEKLTVMEIVR